MKKETDRLYLTPKECALQCGVSTSTIYRWLSEGRIPSAIRTLGNHGRIPVSAIDALVGGQENKEAKGTQKNARTNTEQ